MTFHVWANGVANSFIFRDPDDRNYLLRLLREEVKLSGWTCLSYVVMSSHYHLRACAFFCVSGLLGVVGDAVSEVDA
jgi:hypothetical protein